MIKTKQLKLTINNKIFNYHMLFQYIDFSYLTAGQTVVKTAFSTNKLFKEGKEFEIIKDTSNEFIANIIVDKNIKFITANNKICGLAFKFINKTVFGNNTKQQNNLFPNVVNSFFTGEKMNYRTDYNTSEDWSDFMIKIRETILKSNSHEWMPIKIKGYELTFLSKHVKIYGGMDSNDDILVGFNIDDSYNYFTGEENLTPLNNNKNKIRLVTTMGNYVLGDNKEEFDIFRLYVELCTKYEKYYKSRTLLNLLVDSILVETRQNRVQIAFNKKDKYNIEILTASNKVINCGEILDKISTKKYESKERIIGDIKESFDYENIRIYKRIPNSPGFINRDNFKYLIEIL